MPAFPRDLKEIKERQESERRKKPQETDPKLGAQFKQANKGQVKHLHHDDLDKTDEELKLVLDAETRKDFENGTLTRKELENGLLALDEIFKWIMGETSRLLDKINQGLADFNAADTPAKSDPASKKYAAAVKEFNDHVNALNDPGGTSFGATINAANIEPVKNGGYYTSARVIIEWRGGTHSGSSLIHVP